MEVVWNLNHLYESKDKWREDVSRLEGFIKRLEGLEILESKESLCEFLRNLNDCYQLVEKVYLYPKRILDLQDDDLEAKDMMNRAIQLYNDYLSVENYYKKILVCEKDRVDTMIKDDDYWYRYLYVILRKGNRIASDEVLAKYNEQVPNIRCEYQNLLNEIKFSKVDIDGKEVEVTRKNYSHLLEDDLQENRQKYFSSYMMGYKDKAEDIVKLYIDKLTSDIKLYQSEGYSSLLEKKLFELELDPNTLNNLISSINEHLDIMHEFVALKRDCSGLDKFHTYDASVSFSTGNDQKIEFIKATELVKEALKPLGKEYGDVIDKMLEEGWIDVYPKDHKRTNASTSISYNGVPYILLNYTQSINGARILAHEIGHAIHTYFSKSSNGIEYFEFDLFLTEIISKVNEILFNEYLLSRASDDEAKKEVLNNIVGSLGNTLFNQTMTTEFEHRVIRKLEEGESVCVDYLNDIYMDCMKKYHGDALKLDDLNKYGWLLVTHLVWQESYYLYQYVIGLALGTSIALRIMQDGTYVEKYLELLKVGRRLSIEEALKLVDIDINRENYLDDAFDYLDEKLVELKKLI